MLLKHSVIFQGGGVLDDDDPSQYSVTKCKNCFEGIFGASGGHLEFRLK
jgi:hypothetical protein